MRRPRSAHGSTHIVHDWQGAEWRVFERRKTPYGFDLLLGRPYPTPPVRGGSGGTAVILTPALAKHLRAHARLPYELPLPVGRRPIQRLRTILGIDYRTWEDMRLKWWMDRIDDLATLPIPEFVAKHRNAPWTRSGTISGVLAWQMRIRFLGRQRKPAGWYRRPKVLALLNSDLPHDVVAERLQIAPTRAAELRYKLHSEARQRSAARRRTRRHKRRA